MLIWVMGIITIISAIMVIISRKVVNSVLYLILTFFNSAVIFILIGIPFMGFIYFILYVGAISILFLFVIMMLDLKEIREIKTKERRGKGRIIGTVVSIGGIIIMYMSIWGIGKNKVEIITEKIQYHQEWSIKIIDTMQGIGYILYTEQVSLLILIAIILLIVMVSIINSITT